MDQITLRRAAAPDMEAILKLQVAVFEGEQGIPGELVCSPGDQFLQWWCALEGDSVVGAVAAWKEGEQVHWDGLRSVKCAGAGASAQNWRYIPLKTCFPGDLRRFTWKPGRSRWQSSAILADGLWASRCRFIREP